jgi:hypothetical protein
LWVENPEETQGDLFRPQRLWERWSGRGKTSCPFGVILRPKEPDDMVLPPFPTWEFRPGYLPAPLVLHVGVNAGSIEEPLLTLFSAPRRPGSPSAREPQPLDHRAGFREITALRIFGPVPTSPAPVMRAAEQTGAVSFHRGPEHLAEIGFDGETQGQRADLRPALPLIFYR